MDVSMATRILYSRLLPEHIERLGFLIATLDDTYAKQWRSIDRSTDHWKSLTLKFCTHFVPESREVTLLSDLIPPKGIHMMQRSDVWYVGDFYSTNMALECLSRAGMTVQQHKNYMDFGGSSGSLTRVLAAFEPEADCYCYDPVSESIGWAANNLPVGVYKVSPQSPPVDVASGFFTGVTAISIWSHFSESATMAWFDEMARIVEPNGWLFFTAHGEQTIRWMQQHKRRPSAAIDRIESDFKANGFYFEDYYKGSLHYGLETQEWGNSFITPEWLSGALLANWEMKYYQSGRNQNNQDCYVFLRR